MKLVSGSGVLYKYPALLTTDDALTPELVVDPVAFMYIILEDLVGISGSKCYPCYLICAREALVLPG